MRAEDMRKGAVYKMNRLYEQHPAGTEVEFSHFSTDTGGRIVAIVHPVGEPSMQDCFMMYPQELDAVLPLTMEVSLPNPMPKIRMLDLVKGQNVNFIHYRDGEFLYRTDGGFEFPISLQEIANQKLTLLPSDKAIYYMRWIRKHLELMEREKAEAEAARKA